MLSDRTLAPSRASGDHPRVDNDNAGSADDARVLVYGAYGHTGRFVVDELTRRGVAPVLAGRDEHRLRELGARHPAATLRRFGLEPDQARGGVAGCDVVLNCAGPFLDTARPLASASIAAGAHYLDLTAEQGAADLLYRELDAPARAAGVALVPAMAFYGGLVDLLVTTLLDDHTAADEVTVATWLNRWWPTDGTRRTGARNTATRLYVEHGALTAVPAPPPAAEWDFTGIGRRPVTMVPFSEVMTVTRHLAVGTLRTFLSDNALADVRDPTTSPPTSGREDGRSEQRFVVDVEVRRRDGQCVAASASGQDIYAASAPLIVEGALHLLGGRGRGVGALAPGTAFDAASVLAATGVEVVRSGPARSSRGPRPR
jgi:short subunit dehydrogenase-like uncharacterized protein